MLLRCGQFGFDRKKIQQRLAFLKLSKGDCKIAKRLLAEVIEPAAERIIDRFYEGLLFQSDTRKWLLDGETIEKLKKTQKNYLLSLGIDFDKDEYFEERLQIGVIHAEIGLPLSTYQCAYCNLIQLILGEFPEAILNNKQDNKALTDFVIKITSLDMSLAIETYHELFMSNLESEVISAKSRESHLQSIVEIDHLTEIYNRNYAFSYLIEAIDKERKGSNKLSLMMLDIDFFKKVNDNYGHQVGDEVLKQVAKAIKKNLRDDDVIGRYGGEEFILGLVGVSIKVACQVAERIRTNVAETLITVNNSSINVTLSIGLARLGTDDDLQSLIHRADEALYLAKESGRNCIKVSEVDMPCP